MTTESLLPDMETTPATVNPTKTETTALATRVEPAKPIAVQERLDRLGMSVDRPAVVSVVKPGAAA